MSIYRVEAILLVDIEAIDEIKLDQMKLHDIIIGFQDVIHMSMEPIIFDKRFGRPFKILDGKHRIHSARHKNKKMIPAVVIN